MVEVQLVTAPTTLSTRLIYLNLLRQFPEQAEKNKKEKGKKGEKGLFLHLSSH
jgi:hypothetical protein